MTRDEATDPTLLLSVDSGARRAALFHHRLKSTTYRIAADCERMLESLSGSERPSWRESIGSALIASKQLIAILARTQDSDLDAIRDKAREPHNRINAAMKELLTHVPVTADDELLLYDARMIRESLARMMVLSGTPLATTAERPAVSGEDVASAVERTPRILVADDEPQILDIMARRLKMMGYSVTTAANGRLALDAAEREPLDLVMTDINMPVMNGIELLQALKENELTKDIPVIVISSQNDTASVATCISAGAEDHIAKPPEAAVLEARVRASLERKRMRDIEHDYLRQVAELTAAAERVEDATYVPGSLSELAGRHDPLGRLARVFDRMVNGLKSREERLQSRLKQLRTEMSEFNDQISLLALASDESPFASGETIAGRYEILGHLGRGGMGMVYHARDNELGEDVAIKVVRRDLIREDPTVLDRLKSEIRLARRISHRNVVRAHDLGEWKDTYFLTMEYVQGITLAELLDRRGRLSVPSTLAIGTQIAEALTVAHEQQIVHRDIKPANLLVDEAGTVKVTDFGIARSIDRGLPTNLNITAGGFIIGTPQYMAPEQLMGGTIDGRSDLFALGVVLYECLAGKPPYTGETTTELMAQIVDNEARPLAEIVADIPERLARLIHDQLHLNPNDRSASAREFAHALSEIEIGTG